ncbi:unnamed protein product [Hymenolepis diminuta]|uniref:Uncharacterized protein n=1 Tax=Hymenolepis diminuta TaxID=6216 RepID=A0A564XXF5_HYMDI|nr:unnamed protein product [Hymenolepis diminuta]
MSFSPSYYFIKPSAFIKIPDPAAAEDVTVNVPEFIQDPKSAKFFESRKLDLFEYERYSKFVLPEEFDELAHCETLQVKKEFFGQNLLLFKTHFICPKLVIKHDEDLYEFARAVNFHSDKFDFDIFTEKQFITLNFTSLHQVKLWLLLRVSLLKLIKIDLNMKLKEMGRGAKMANLTRDTTLTNSDAMPMRMMHKIAVSMSQSAQFMTQPNPSLE